MEMPNMAPSDDPLQTIERLLPAAREAAQARGTRDPIWEMVNRAETLLAQATTDEKRIASAIADWMTVRFGADPANLSRHRT
jgi:hypothetical protein